jgi:hypothetical protein
MVSLNGKKSAEALQQIAACRDLGLSDETLILGFTNIYAFPLPRRTVHSTEPS